MVVDATGDADVAARAGAPIDGGHRYFSAGMYFAVASVNIEQYKAPVVQREPDPKDLRWAESVSERVCSRLKHLEPLLPYCRAAWEADEYQFLKQVGALGTILCDHGIFRSVSSALVSGVQVADPLRIGR